MQHYRTSIEEKIELETLRQKIKHVEELRVTEKSRLEEQIEMFKEMLNSERLERQRAIAQLKSLLDKHGRRYTYSMNS